MRTQEQIDLEVNHIFESGANEIRVSELIKRITSQFQSQLSEKDREIEQERQKSQMLYEVIDWIIKSKHIWINDKDESNGVVDLLKLRLKEYNQPQPGDSGTKQDSEK
jgi:hypothetical protein